MGMFSQMILSDSVEINTTPEKIWEFFTNLEKNYKTWHPEDHILFKWTKGKPMESGSRWYGEEIVRGKLFKLKGTIGEVIPNRKIVFNFSFPVSLVAPKFEWLIEPKGSTSVFTARSYLRAGEFYLKFFKKEMNYKLDLHNKHVREEGENLKRILESR
jgi:uncharacterized protein YndB with AHSA1/START domain